MTDSDPIIRRGPACSPAELSARIVHAREVDELLALFAYEHLPPELASVSRPFAELAARVGSQAPDLYQTVTALQRLLDAKDAAVRAAVVVRKRNPLAGGWDDERRARAKSIAQHIVDRVLPHSVVDVDDAYWKKGVTDELAPVILEVLP